MKKIWLTRFFHPETGMRVGLQKEGTVYDLTDHYPGVRDWLAASVGRVQEAIDELERLTDSAPSFAATQLDQAPQPDKIHWLAPVDQQDIWAAGVTYWRSREARQEEAIDGGDVYARVYNAERPEIFFKARGFSVIGHLGEVGIRADASWSVPEPELAVMMNPAMEVVGFSAGNDMSSRDIEGENPLYLPQAKVYTASCAIGHGILLQAAASWITTTIRLKIARNSKTVFENQISTTQIKRGLAELITYLGRSNAFPDGVALLTGTGIVPPADFTLQAGDNILIDIDGVATLRNRVRVV